MKVSALRRLALFLTCLLPLVWIIYGGVTGALGPDPGKTLVLATGIWSLRFLIITLAITPVRTLFGYGKLLAYRRMLGLYAWFYACLHFFAVWTYLLGWSWGIFLEEFADRPYMTVGIVAWLMLIPLGVTSNRWTQGRLGRRWKRLHQLIYPIAILACIHFAWLVRSDYTEVAFYSVLVAALLVVRVPAVCHRVKKRARAPGSV